MYTAGSYSYIKKFCTSKPRRRRAVCTSSALQLVSPHPSPPSRAREVQLSDTTVPSSPWAAWLSNTFPGSGSEALCGRGAFSRWFWALPFWIVPNKDGFLCVGYAEEPFASNSNMVISALLTFPEESLSTIFARSFSIAGRPGHCGVLSFTPGFSPLGAASTPRLVWQPRMSLDVARCCPWLRPRKKYRFW